jgi:dipeptidyl aminopeptidase/acylaminoacyl peptidase
MIARPGSRLALTMAALAAVASIGSGRPVSRAVTVDDLMALRSIVDVKIAPNGERVAYVVSTPSLPKNEHEAALFVVPAAGGAAIRLGESLHILNTTVPAPRLRWSPDGASVSVLALAGQVPQVFAIPVAGGAPRQLTTTAEGVFLFEWSPDGRSLAYLTRDPMPADEAQQRQDKSFVMHVDAPERPSRLVVEPIGSGSPRTLSLPGHYVDSLAWAPDSRELVYSAASRGGFGSAYDTRIYAVPSAGGAPRAVVDRTGMNTGPQYSPDGRTIAFVSTGGRAEIMASRSLTTVPVSGGVPRAFLLDDAWATEIAWSRDSRSIYVLANDGTFASREHVFEQPLVRVPVDGSAAERLDPALSVDYSMSVSRDGDRLAYRAVEGRSMGDVVVQDLATKARRKLTDLNPELHDFALGELKPVKWRSFDGMEIWGLLLTPPGYSSGRLPLLLYLHGGPGGGVTYGLFPQFMHTVGQVDPYPTEAMASAGFAVLFPMPRGGAGYGEAGQRAIVNAWGEADYRDIMAGADELIARGVADPDRLGVMGASYGGYMTDWVVTQTGRFKAASAGASLSDLTDVYYLSDGGQFIVEYFKLPWENRESYTAHSPITHAARVTTPLLIQHGERDQRAPIAGAWKFYRALKGMGKTVELDIYPRGGHVLYEPMQEREAMRRNLDWFRRWIPQESPGR